MSLADKLRGVDLPVPRKREPLWRGPEEDGITFSLLSRFLTCRERFRVRVVEGLRPADAFNHRIEYGQMWHVCEEALAKGDDPTRGGRQERRIGLWEDDLRAYVGTLCRRYPLSQEQIDHWYRVCLVQFPCYVEHWKKHPDVTGRTPLLQEQVFDVPYKLPSGRSVRLRGKWDSVDLVGDPKGKGAGVWLQENKTKGEVDEVALSRQLTFDLQTMLYLVALQGYHFDAGKSPDPVAAWGVHNLRGVRYNVVRRPLSGGKGTIVRHKPSKSNPQGESKEAYYARVLQVIEEDPEYYFKRWNVAVTERDVVRFRKQCLDPVLEQLCDWYECVVGCSGERWERCKRHGSVHWRHPFGCANTIDEYGHGDLDAYLESGSEVGLQRVEDLFPELT